MKPATKQILTVIAAFVAFGLIGRYVKNGWVGGMLILILAGYAGWKLNDYQSEKPLTLPMA